MSLSISLTPGYTWTIGEEITEDKLNLAANPTVNLAGSIGTATIADGSVTTAKLADGVLSADVTGQGKMANGFFTADASGRAKFATGFLTATLMDDSTRLGVAQYAAGVQTSGVYAVTLAPAIATYVTGMLICFKADSVNTTPTKLNANTLGDKPLVKNGAGTALAAGDIQANDLVTVRYDGSNFVLVDRRSGGTAIIGSVRNLVCAWTSNTSLTMTADEAVVKDAASNSFLATALNVTVNANVSGAANELDAGALASSTWYYLWVIWNGTTASGLLSTSSTAPTLPTGYFAKALVGAVRSDGSTHLVPFLQYDRTVWVQTTNAQNVLFTSVPSGDHSAYTLLSVATAVPPIAKQVLCLFGNILNASQTVRIIVSGDNTGLGEQMLIVTGGATLVDTFYGSTPFELPLASGTQTFYWKMDASWPTSGGGSVSLNHGINLRGYRL